MSAYYELNITCDRNTVKSILRSFLIEPCVKVGGAIFNDWSLLRWDSEIGWFSYSKPFDAKEHWG